MKGLILIRFIILNLYFFSEWVKSCWDCDFAEFPPLEALTEADIVENEHHVPSLYSLSSIMDEWISKKEGQEGEGVNENYHFLLLCFMWTSLSTPVHQTKKSNSIYRIFNDTDILPKNTSSLIFGYDFSY